MGTFHAADMNKNASPLPAPDRPVLQVVEDRIIVNNLELTDAGLAGYVAGVPEPERPGLAANALRVGLQALAHAGTGANVDLVRTEFGRMVEQMAATQARAAEALDASLRAAFADGDGKLPRTLEDFLGDSGKLQRLTGALFDPNRRDSAIGQLNDTLGKYFDGDGSRLAQLLDPTREASPLYQFRNEVSGEFRSLGERIAALEAASRARADERARGTAKGVEFEDEVEAGLAELARGRRGLPRAHRDREPETPYGPRRATSSLPSTPAGPTVASCGSSSRPRTARSAAACWRRS